MTSSVGIDLPRGLHSKLRRCYSTFHVFTLSLAQLPPFQMRDHKLSSRHLPERYGRIITVTVYSTVIAIGFLQLDTVAGGINITPGQAWLKTAVISKHKRKERESLDGKRVPERVPEARRRIQPQHCSVYMK